MDVKAIRNALATVDVTGLTTSRSWVDGVELPALVIGDPRKITYVTDYAGTSTIEWPVAVVFSRADERSALDAIDAAESIGHAGSVVDGFLAVTGPWRSLDVNELTSPPEAITVGDTAAVQIEFLLTIKARRSQ